METEQGDANNIPCSKTETPEEQKDNEAEVREGKDDIAASPKEEDKSQPKVEEEEQEELKEEPSAEGEKSSKPAEDEEEEVPEEKKSLTPADSPTAELTEHPPSSPKAQPDHKPAEKEETEVNPESPKSPKSADTEKSPEDEEEERMDEDDKSEKSSQAEEWQPNFPSVNTASAASEQKNFDEESIASLSTSAQNETRDGFCPDDLPETTALHALQERAYAFSFWPKDRLMINRMDNICETVLKGKWPVNRRHIFDFPGNLLPGQGSALPTAAAATVTESPLQRRSLAELTMAGIHTPYSGSEDKTLSPQFHVSATHIGGRSDPASPERRRRRRKIEIEAERATKRRNLMEMVAQLRESHSATDTQSQAIDLTKGMHHHHKAAPSLAGFPSALATSPSLKAQMELLLQAPPSAHRANGSLEADLPIMKRRRGRRKNVEGLELLFMGNKRAGGDDGDGTKASGCSRAHRTLPVPEQSPSARSLASGSMEEEEAAVSNKELGEWLRQHPTYTMDMAAFTPKSEDVLLSQFSKPKQKRHRCRNPNKIDITLTGEERVPVVNRRNGRKMGGAMAPPMKELPRWLLENTEYSIALIGPTSSSSLQGFLPEAMFDRLLTGPVVREEGVRRRGRRPKSEIAKAAAVAQASAAAQAAQVSLLSAASSAAGCRADGLPPPSDPKQAAASAAASMLPLMLPGMGGLPNMAALPNMFSLGGLFGGNLATVAAAAAASSPRAATSQNSNGTMQGEGGDGEGEDYDEEEAVEEVEANSERAAKKARKRRRREQAGSDVTAQTLAADSSVASINGDAAALLAAAGMSASSLAFNPFLLSTMAPGLLYPSMFLPPGLGGLSLPGFPSASTLAELQSAMAGALGGNALTTTLPSNQERKGGLKLRRRRKEEEGEGRTGGKTVTWLRRKTERRRRMS
ncbi:hypothetical protein F7725_012066 [Dissostichus mawsoni]|uniref:BRK domain-containing protein n=1 Tax=Dissostichus mawsoni TaxID=36200 RepID=A0A7J5ZAQ5_DISMA|nr:hypothetical protein F7725_012066 [Dissostichus mawsoni]